MSKIYPKIFFRISTELVSPNMVLFELINNYLILKIAGANRRYEKERNIYLFKGKVNQNVEPSPSLRSTPILPL